MLPFFKKAREARNPRCAALVAAAGSSARMGGVNKLLQPLEGVPVLVRTLAALQVSGSVDEIVVAAREEDILEISQLCRTYGLTKCKKVIRGGENRTQSARLGTLECASKAKLIAIHDGARPFVTVQVIEDAVAQAAVNGAAAPAVPVKDTIKAAHDGLVERTLDRTELYAVQTPQVFDGDLIRAALQKAVDDGVSLTDDCAAVERLGMRVALTPGDERNIKLTTPADLLIGEILSEEVPAL